MPPLTCPSPSLPRQPDDQDCPLHDARLDVVGQDAALRRLVVMESRAHVGLSDLIQAEATSRPETSRPQPALPPAESSPIFIRNQKGVPT